MARVFIYGGMALAFGPYILLTVWGWVMGVLDCSSSFDYTTPCYIAGVIDIGPEMADLSFLMLLLMFFGAFVWPIGFVMMGIGIILALRERYRDRNKKLPN